MQLTTDPDDRPSGQGGAEEEERNQTHGRHAARRLSSPPRPARKPSTPPHLGEQGPGPRDDRSDD